MQKVNCWIGKSTNAANGKGFCRRKEKCLLKKKHRHVWFYKERGYGIPPKQNLPKPLKFPGHKAECECGAKMFFPDDPELYPVEIEWTTKWRNGDGCWHYVLSDVQWIKTTPKCRISKPVARTTVARTANDTHRTRWKWMSLSRNPNDDEEAEKMGE